jgi:hypothetical protein
MSQNIEQVMDLYDQVYDYLHETWDPIGVKAFGEPAGEYSNYVEKEQGFFDGRFVQRTEPSKKIYRREKGKQEYNLQYQNRSL